MRKSFEQWQADGGEDALARPRSRCAAMPEAYVAPELDADVHGALDVFIERRTGELL